MTKKDKYLIALDVGSAKTCAVIGEVDDTGVKFVSMGAAESKGLRKGLIANIGATATSVRRAIEEAEGVAGIPVERAIVGVAGSHVRGVNSRGGITLGHRGRDINRVTRANTAHTPTASPVIATQARNTFMFG